MQYPAFANALSSSCFIARGHIPSRNVCRRRTSGNFGTPRYSTTSSTPACAANVRSLPISSLEKSSDELVDTLLSEIGSTDGGPGTSASVRSSVDALIRVLSERGRSGAPLSDARIFDQYRVAYTSPSRKQARQGAPAGGRFRGRLGRLLFRPRGLFQHVFAPNIVVNLVAFKLFGLLPGAVGLYGKLTPIEDAKSPNTVRVDFGSPRISFFRLVFQFGPPSFVCLETTYIDDRVRIGIGSRGSLFVFTKGAEARNCVASEWQLLFPRDGPRPLPAFFIPVVGVLLLGAAFLHSAMAALILLLAVVAGAYARQTRFTGHPVVG